MNMSRWGMMSLVQFILARNVLVSALTVLPPSSGLVWMASTSYAIAVTNGKLQPITPSNYTSDLIMAMDELAVSVGLQVFVNNKTLLRRLLRKLQAKVSTPTNITSIASTDCPSGLSLSDACETVTASVPLVFSKKENQTEITNQYLAALNAAVNGGSLEIFLTQIDPNTVVRILQAITPSSSAPTQIPQNPTTPKSLSRGATAGIVVGTAAITVVTAWEVTTKQQQENHILHPVTIFIADAQASAAEKDAGTL